MFKKVIKRNVLNRIFALILPVVMVFSMFPLSVFSEGSGESESIHIATYVGVTPKVDGVTWDESTFKNDLFSRIYETVDIAGKKNDGTIINAKVEIVPRDTVYFIDNFSAAPIVGTTPSHTAVKDLVGDGLLNESADKVFVAGDKWGLSTSSSFAAKANIDISKRTETGIYGGNGTGNSLRYTFALEAGTYTLMSGHYDWWAKNRPMSMTLNYGDTTLSAGSLNATGNNNFQFTLAEAQTVTYKITCGGFEASILSWIAVSKGSSDLKHNLNYQLDNLELEYGQSSVFDKGTLNAMLKPSSALYILPQEIEVKMNGDLLSTGDYTYDAETGKITSENITGIVSVTASGVDNSSNIYTVSFTTDGGSETESQDIAQNGKVIKPTDPVKRGYAFAGWFSDAELQNEWDFENDAVTANISFYAKWEANAQNTAIEDIGGIAVRSGASWTSDYSGGQMVALSANWISGANSAANGGASFVNPEVFFKQSEFTLYFDFVNKETSNNNGSSVLIGNADNHFRIIPIKKDGAGYLSIKANGVTKEVKLDQNIPLNQWNAVAISYTEDGTEGKVSVFLNGEKILEQTGVGFKMSAQEGIVAGFSMTYATGYINPGNYDNVSVSFNADGDSTAMAETLNRATAMVDRANSHIIKYDLTNIEMVSGPHYVATGESADIVLKAMSGNVLPETIIVTMAGNSSPSYSYDAVSGAVKISNITGEVTISGISGIDKNAHEILIKGSDVDKAASNVNGLPFKGWGMINGNSTSNLLPDYKAESPDKYWAMMEYLFGGEYPLFTHVKMEMGNDGNNSTGADAATMRSADDEADASRSPGFQMAADAKKFNPNLKISMLRWGLPNWVANAGFSSGNYEAFYIWYRETIFDAYEKYGYVVDYINPDTNETTNPNATLIKWFANRLANETEFPVYMDAAAISAYKNIKIVASDENKSLQIVPKMRADADLYEVVDAIGFHYRTTATSDYVAMADVDDKEVWYSEGCATFGYTELQENKTASYGGGTLGGYQSPLAMIDGYVNSFVSSRRSHYIFQPAIGAFYEGIQYGHKELLSARDPWSGYVHYDPALYMIGHFSKFSKTGWENDANTNGIWRGIVQASYASFGGSDNEHMTNEAGNPGYMTLASPDKSNYSVVFINNSAKTQSYKIKHEDLNVSENAKLEIWETATDSYMQYKGDVEKEDDGYYYLTVKPFSMVTATTLDCAESTEHLERLPESGERTVLDTDASGKNQGVTDDDVLYADDFQYAEEGTVTTVTNNGAGTKEVSYLESRGNEPRYMLDSRGAWIVEEGRLVQSLGSGVSQWNGGDPNTIVGDFHWMNYKASIDTEVATGYAEIAIRAQSGMNIDNSGYRLRIVKNGDWTLYRAGTVVRSGSATPNSEGKYNIALSGRGNIITGYVDGEKVCDFTDSSPMEAGRVKIASGWNVTYFDNLLIEPINGYMPYIKEMIDGQDDSVSYTGGWTIDGPGGGSADDWYRTVSKNSENGASFSFPISGTGFTIVGANGNDTVLDVYINDVLTETNVSTLSVSRRYSTYSYSGLANGTYTVKIVVKSGTLTVDALYTLGGLFGEVSKADLQALVDKVNGYIESDYVTGFDVFEAALASAKNVLSNANASQSDIDQAFEKLEEAVKGLKKSDDAVSIEGTPEMYAVIKDGVISGLPENVSVTLANGSSTTMPIVWEGNLAENFTKEFEIVNIVGTVSASLSVTVPVMVIPAQLKYFIDSGTGDDWAKPPVGDGLATYISHAYSAVSKLLGTDLLNDKSDKIYNMADKENTWGVNVGLRPSSTTKTDPLRSPDGALGGSTTDPYPIGIRTIAGAVSYVLELDAGSYALHTGAYDWYGSRTRNFAPIIEYTDLDGEKQALTLDVIALPADTYTERSFVLPEHIGNIKLTYAKTSGEDVVLSWLAISENTASNDDQTAVDTAKDILENNSAAITVKQTDGNTASELKDIVAENLGKIDGILETGVTISVQIADLIPAKGGTVYQNDGTDGSFTWTATISKGGAYDTVSGTGKITAKVYEPYVSIAGVEDGLWLDDNGKHIQAHGGQVQWDATLDLDEDGMAEGGWIWYGEDKSRDGKPIDGIHCYVSADLYNWIDKGVVLNTHDLLPMEINDSNDGVTPDLEAYAKIKAWAEMNAPTDQVSLEQIEMAKSFVSAYRNQDGTYDEANLMLAFQNLYTAYCIVERPKMLYNETTKQYVLVYHADGPSDANILKMLDGTAPSPSRYARASMGFAVSDTPYGPFKLVNVQRMNHVDGYYDSSKGMARDMTVFLDDTDIDGDGVKDAYAIYSSEQNKYMYVSLLNSDYTGPATEGTVDTMDSANGVVKAFAARVLGTDQTDREAPAVFKYNGYYYMITSGTSGWLPNQARYHRADNIFGPYTAMGDPCIGDDDKTTFASQSTAVIPIDAANGKFIYMGDRWIVAGTGSASHTSGYVWLPLEIGENNTISIGKYSDWTLDVLDNLGPVTINTEIPKSVFVGNEISLPDTLNITVAGNTKNVSVVWDKIGFLTAENDIGTHTFTATIEDLGGRNVAVKINVIPKNIVYFVDSGMSSLSDFFEAVVSKSPLMKNKTVAEQLYSEDDGWGYVGTSNGRVGTGELFESLRYSTGSVDRTIAYNFDDLDAGTYKVYIGYYDPWYNSSQGKRVTSASLLVDGVQSGAAKQHTITSEKNMLILETELSAGEKLSVLNTPVNTGSNTDTQVSFVFVTKLSSEDPNQEYTVSFDANGGSDVSSVSATENSVISEPTAPTKDGHLFSGWYTDSELLVEYDFDTPVMSDFTLYAKWTEKTVDPSAEITGIIAENGKVSVYIDGLLSEDEASFPTGDFTATYSINGGTEISLPLVFSGVEISGTRALQSIATFTFAKIVSTEEVQSVVVNIYHDGKAFASPAFEIEAKTNGSSTGTGTTTTGTGSGTGTTTTTTGTGSTSGTDSTGTDATETTSSGKTVVTSGTSNPGTGERSVVSIVLITLVMGLIVFLINKKKKNRN